MYKKVALSYTKDCTIHLLFILGLILCINLCSPVMADTWTVCSSGCNFTAIQEAINHASDGDTIEIQSGTYYESLIVNRSLNLTGMDTGAGFPVINASGAEYGIILESPDSIMRELTVSGADSSAVLIEGDGIQLRELTIIHPKVESQILTSPAVTGENISDLAISSCTFEVLMDCVALYDPHDYSITHCTFDNPTAYSVAIISSGEANPSVNGIISGNTITQERGAGIGIVARSAGGLVNNLTISDNIISGSGGSIGLFIPSEAVIIRNNTLTENPGAPGKGIYGIMTYGTSGVLIEDNHVHGTDVELAFRFESCTGLNVTGNTVDGNSDTGLGFLGVTDSVVSGNIMENNVYNFWMSPVVLAPGELPGNVIDPTNLVDGKPVWYFEGIDDLSLDGSDNVGALILYGCDNADIRDLSCRANSDGVLAVRSENLTITNCTFQQMYRGIMAVASPHLTVTDNQILDCFDGLMIGDLPYGLVSGNQVENSADCGIVTGIYLEDVTISDNEIVGAVAGVALDSVSAFNNATFIGNSISHTTVAAITASDSEGALITGNDLYPESGVGFDISSCSLLNISENTLGGDAAIAVLLYNSPENTITSNTLSATENGFILQRKHAQAGSLDNVITNNLISAPEPVLFCIWGVLGDKSGPSRFGIGPETPREEIPPFSPVSTVDSLSGEDFSCNPDHSPPQNTWNTTKAAGPNLMNGPFLGGNYWAKPDGTGWSQVTPDRGDGFCNAPLILGGSNTDFLPLHTRVEPPFYADFSASPRSGNLPLSVQFTDRSDGQPARWIYAFGDGSFATTKNPVHTYRMPGNYTVNLTIMKIARSGTVTNTTVKQNYITITGPPVPDLRADFNATPRSGSAPLSVQFTDQSTGGPTRWSYSFGDGTFSTARNPVHTYRIPGTYTVNMTVLKVTKVGTISNTTIKEGLITVTGPPAPVFIANFTAAPLAGAAPLSVNFTDTSTGNPQRWYYSFGDGSSTTARNPVHTYRWPGTYTVELTIMKISPSGLMTNTTVKQDLVHVS